MKRILITTTILIYGFYLYGQSHYSNPNLNKISNVNLRLAGGTQLYSINYEHQIFRFKKIRFNSKIGIGRSQEFGIFGTDADRTSFTPNAGLFFLIGNRKSRLEIGLDFVFFQRNDNIREELGTNKLKVSTSGNIAYRFIPDDRKKLFFGFNASFVPQGYDKWPLYLPVGFTVGKFIGKRK